MKVKAGDLRVQYRNDGWSLGPLSFDVPKNTTMGLVGPNGAGKSTFFRALIGDVPVTGGTLEVAGQDLLAMNDGQRARRLSYMGQNPSMAFNFSVREVVRMAEYAHAESRPERVNWCLERVGMADYAERTINDLSGGQRRRVYLARALAQAPDVLLLDEPSSNLDVKFTWELAGVLGDARRRFDGMTVLWAQHDLEQASRVCDQLVLFRNGKRYAGPDRPLEVLTSRNLNEVYDIDANVRPDSEKGGVRIVPASRRNTQNLQSLF